MEDERLTGAVHQEFAAEVPQERDTMEDFWRPVIQDEYSTVRQPAIDANNFELKLVPYHHGSIEPIHRSSN